MDFILSEKFKTYKEICDKFGYNDYSKYEYISEYILKLYNYKIIETDNVDKLVWNGNYYLSVEKDYIEMKKYYLMAIELNNSEAMYNFAHYYENIEKDYVKMKKYYLMAIEFNNSYAMCNLAHYYENIENDYVEMKKYYLMAIELNNSDSDIMYYLGVYYQFVEKDYIEMKKYYLMAIELNESRSMNNLGIYYQYIEKNHVKMIKYYLMAIELNNSHAIEISIENNHFNNDKIKNAIIKKKFKIVNEEILCPITLDYTNKCYITVCNHKFSSVIIECKICPLCRNVL